MRIEILGGSVSGLQTTLSRLQRNIGETADALRAVYGKLDSLTGGDSSCSSQAKASVQRRLATELRAQQAVADTAQQLSTFLDHTRSTDAQVAVLVQQSKRAFLSTYPWLRPPAKEEKSWLQQRLDDWNAFWSGVGETLAAAWESICDWVKDHAVELAVGTVCVAVAAVLTILSGGTLAAVGTLLCKVGISALISAGIGAGAAALTGGDVGDAFGDGLASGYMLGGIFASVNSVITAVRFVKEGGILTFRNFTDGYRHYSAAAIDKLQNTEYFKDSAIDHIFNGNKSGGYHYVNIDGTPGRIIEGTQSAANGYGAFQADVVINGKTKMSTFFPTSMSPQQVVDAINQSFATKQFLAGNTWVGQTQTGSYIGMYIQQHTGKIISAFPLYEVTQDILRLFP